MRFGFIMDPLETVKKQKDTTFFLMLAAAQRGHEVFYIDQDDLSVVEGECCFKATTVVPRVDLPDGEIPFEVGEKKVWKGSEFASIWMRKDPPLDRRYFYATLCLDFLSPQVLVVNRPQSLRDWNEKLAAMLFAEFTPKTAFTADLDEVKSFIRQFDRFVLKPVDGHGGRGIHVLDSKDPEALKLVEEAISNSKQKVILQEVVPDADKGDKRILLWQGKPIGSVLRVGLEGGLNNLDQGGEAVATELTDHERRICKALEPELVKRDLFFVGIDILGEKLTEINVTSPTGLQEAARFAGRDLHLEIIEKVESLIRGS